MSFLKIVNILSVISGVSISFLAYIYFTQICGVHSCEQKLIDGTLTSLIWGPLAVAAVMALLLPFPARIFRLWLMSVFSWAFPLSVYMVYSIDIYSSSIFSLGRGEAAVLLGKVFGTITILFIGGVYLYEWWKGRRVEGVAGKK